MHATSSPLSARADASPTIVGLGPLREPVRLGCWGLLSRRPRWGISLRGYLLLFAAGILAGIGVLRGIYPFLSVTDRRPATVLVVEGWVHDYAIRAAVAELNAGNCQTVFTTGGPVQGIGGYQNDFNTAASIGAARLKAAGVEPSRVQMVPARSSQRDRTYGSAIALRNRILSGHAAIRSINVMTEDVHARRTQLLFQQAFGSDVTVGVIAVPNPDYLPQHWWRYSEGVREVIGETIAYIYAKFFFFPSVSPIDASTTPSINRST